MKKCTKCGEVFDDSWEVCLHCQAKLIRTENDSVQKPVKQEEHPKIILSASQKVMVRTLTCALAILLIILVIFKGPVTSLVNHLLRQPLDMTLEDAKRYGSAFIVPWGTPLIGGEKVSTGEIVAGIGSAIPSLLIGLLIGISVALSIKTYKLPWILNRVNLVLIVIIVTSIVMPILRYLRIM